MIELKASTARGKQVVAIGERHEGYFLSDVYNSYSTEKLEAYQRCRDMYAIDLNATGFGICSHNTFGFTVSWYTVINNENVMRVETKENSYMVWLDR